MELDFAEIDVSREYFFIILEYGGTDFDYIKSRLFTGGIERFVFLQHSSRVGELLSILETHQISYDIKRGDYVPQRVRFLDRGDSKGGFFRTEMHNISLRDSKIREFTDEEKALIMRYKIEGGDG